MSAQDKTAASRRSQALTGAFAGVAVIAILVAVYVGIQLSDDDEPTAAPTAVATQPAEAPAAPSPAAPAAPAQPQLDPALQKPPVLKPGKGDVTELKITTLIEGTGPKLVAGQTIMANYIGATYSDGKVFDSSWERGQPAQFPVGVGRLIPGWDKGLVGVPVGSRVQLDIPADLAYGESPDDPAKPAGDLRFIVDILAAQ